MAFSDALIYLAIQELLETHGPEQVITQEMIESHSGISHRTTQRALKKLMVTGKLIGDCTHRRNGYRYRLPDDTPHSQRS